MILLFLSFIAGVLTTLAPCVFPLLPVIIGGSITGDTSQKRRPYVIALSLTISILLFTLLLKVSISLASLTPEVLTTISGGIVIGLGIVTIFPSVWETIILFFNFEALSQRFLNKGTTSHNTIIGPVLIGVALGPVFSSCSPTYAFILASILPKNLSSGIIYLAAYTIGLAGTLLLVALLGRRIIMKRYTWLIDTRSTFRRVLGVIFVVIGLLIVSGNEVTFETWLANRLPFDETKIEQVLLGFNSTNGVKTITPLRMSVLNTFPTPEPELTGLTNWINSSPLTLSSLKGKVVLVDFWTYSCVNCNRALPYVKTWYNTYKNKGLVVLGIHTPEFAFEHIASNVQKFVTTNSIPYPVALDNTYETWNAFNNTSWPADYLIDKDGNIRYVSLGEGGYDTTEKAIQELLGLNTKLRTPTSTAPVTSSQSPETYFGTDRASSYSGAPDLNAGTVTFTPQPIDHLSQNTWTLGGTWNIAPENITSLSNTSSLSFHVSAKDVYVVAGTSNSQSTPVSITISSSNQKQYGSDDPNGTLFVSGSKLYHIASFSTFESAIITLTVPKGISLYTFTFGS